MKILIVSKFLISFLLPALVFPATFWIQVRLGYEVSLFPLYMFPIAMFSWSFGLAGCVVSVLLATGLWYWGVYFTGHQYVHEWTVYYNTAARGFVFAMIGGFIIIFKRVVAQHMSRMEAMRTLMNVCHGCGAVQGSDGRWIPLEELASIKARPVCECDECRRLHHPSALSSNVNESAMHVERDQSQSWRVGDPERRKRQRREEDR